MSGVLILGAGQAAGQLAVSLRQGGYAEAIQIASALIREVGYEPVLVGTLATMGKHLIPGTPLAGERSPEEVRRVAATLK